MAPSARRRERLDEPFDSAVSAGPVRAVKRCLMPSSWHALRGGRPGRLATAARVGESAALQGPAITGIRT
jgi:hypothetical protein